MISAKAGGINAVTGQASVHSKGDSDWQQLTITDDLNDGDRVRTAHDGRVEILLNPGSYLRVGGNTEVELANNSLANLEVRLIKGTAIVEATGADGLELNINISTPHTKLAIVRQGLYRLNVVPGDTTELIVRKGRVILSDSSHTKVKGGNKVIFSQVNVSVAKLTKEEKKRLEQQEVDLWSKERAETLAKANRRVTERMLNSAFASFRDPFRDPFYSRGFGIWFFNTRVGCYTFIPFYYGWGSPYGSSYTTAIYAPYIGSRHYPGGGTPSTGSNGGGYPSSGGASSGGVRPVSPPSGGFGDGGGRVTPMPSRRIDSDTGRPMPRKSLEISRPNN
ncbi:MAG TPA: FecR family protein [Pyrinomonadaceae bacterium]|nr:FecR family protein [Pyrinomonadaceae bacterium]